MTIVHARSDVVFKNKQSLRSFVAFLVTWAFVVLTVTGIVLYVVPHGRVAYWIHWALLGLEKDAWANVHMMFGGVFIAAAVIHLYYNWKPFKKFLAERVSGHFQLSRELVASVVLSAAVFVAAVAGLPPVSWVFDLNENIKDAWVTNPDLEPPFGHAEEVSLAGLALRMQLDLDAGVAELRRHGLKLNGPRDSLEAIARANDTTPMAVYALIRGFKREAPKPQPGEYTPEKVEALYAGTGVGQKTLSEICDQVGVGLEAARARLALAGVEIEAGDKLRPVADRYGVSPIDILKLILVEDYELPADS
jgi:hypothetical protein